MALRPSRRAPLARPVLALLPFLSLAPLGCNDAGSGDTPPMMAPLEVMTAAGPVRGLASGQTRVYYGIRYAQPPVGTLRFAPPRPALPWTTTFEAKDYAPICPQAGLTGGYDPHSNEDCLALNVWAPSTVASAPRPVMVFIHGGGFVLGAGSEATYNGQNLSEAGDVVVVTLNYRLGALGFLAHAGLSAEDSAHHASGNWGLMDQQLALAWVKDNIAAFGGDPRNVTIFGESAGGYSVCAHLLAPKSRGLFHRAIIESGYCTTIPSPTLAEAEKQGADVAGALGCTGDAAAQVACLRGKAAKEVIAALPAKPGLIGATGVAWGGIVDGVVLTDQPRALFAAGKSAPVPLVVGANSDEGTLFFALGANLADEAELRATFAGNFSQQEIDKVVARYPVAQYGSANKAAIAIIGDSFVCEARRVARGHSAVAPAAFEYHFSRAFKWLFPDLGAFHSAEIPYVFGNAYQGFPIPEADLPLSAAMQTYWTGFARRGTVAGVGPVEWPAYLPRSDSHLRLDSQIATGTGLRKEACDFFDSL